MSHNSESSPSEAYADRTDGGEVEGSVHSDGYVPPFVTSQAAIDYMGVTEMGGLEYSGNYEYMYTDSEDNDSYASDITETDLISAVKTGKLEACTSLELNEDEINTPDVSGKSPLQIAAGDGLADIVKWLIDKSADVNAMDPDMRGPLFDAVRSPRDRAIIIDLLLRAGADARARDGDGLTPLEAALGVTDIEMDVLRRLAEKDSETLMRIVSRCTRESVKSDNNVKLALRLIGASSDLNFHGSDPDGETTGKTPLGLAAEKGCLILLQALIDHKANVDLASATTGVHDVQLRPLHYAVESNSLECVRSLLDGGAQVDGTTSRDRTPLHFAAELGKPDIVRLLLEKKAAPTKLSRSGFAAVYLACNKGHDDVAMIILEYMTEEQIIAVQRTSRRSLLWLAVYNDCVEVTRHLINIASSAGSRSSETLLSEEPEETIVTAFPRPWHETSMDLHKIIHDHIWGNIPSRPPILTIWEMITAIVSVAVNESIRWRCHIVRKHERVFGAFNSTIWHVNDKEVTLLDDFKETIARSHETPNGKPKNIERASFHDIRKEVELLKEVKDVQDELGIIEDLLKKQSAFMFQHLFSGPHLTEEGKALAKWYEHRKGMDMEIWELSQMSSAADQVQKNINHLLDLRQKQANLEEAVWARKSSEETSRQGKTILVFTVVTIIFVSGCVLSFFKKAMLIWSRRLQNMYCSSKAPNTPSRSPVPPDPENPFYFSFQGPGVMW
ncbi:Ankyrin-3 [Orbilia brochopaga]|nr:Ankyrin-3 [Drechslerella brochopaga]